MSTLALIGLGSNLGDRKATLDAAVAALAETPGVEVLAVSSYHETAPAGGPGGQGAFLNAAARLMTTLDPLVLLGTLHSIELQAGRSRETRWGARTLDLDLLMYNNKRIETPGLTLPHPRLGVRRFVLAPLAEVAPEIVDPLTNLTIAQLLDHLDRRPSYVALAGPDGPLKAFLFDTLVAELPAIGVRWSGMVPWTKVRRSDGPLLRFYRDCIGRAELLVASLWPAEMTESHWLVTDFFLDEEITKCPGGKIADVATRRAYDRADRAADDALRPTFVVVLGDPKLARRRRGGTRVPLLRPESDDPDAVAAEVLAACAASRGE